MSTRRCILSVESMESRDLPSGVGLGSGNGAGQYIVTLRAGVDAEQFAGELRGQGREVLQVYGRGVNGLAFRGSALGHDPRVAAIEPDQMLYAVGKPGVPVSPPPPPPAEVIPTGVRRVGGPGGGLDLSHVNIAILDTGIDSNHPDLNVVGGMNFTTAKSFADDNGHGTHVAGTAAALDNNIGVVGVAPGAPLWAVKVLNRQGGGWLSDIIQGVEWVTSTRSDSNPDNDIAVANMSLGAFGDSPALHDAIRSSVNLGVVYVVAAGNAGEDAGRYFPAHFNEVITVSALADSDGVAGGTGPSTPYGADDTLADFSNFGADVDIAAPGVNIYSTYRGGGYATLSGTSMATPHVAGAVALYIAGHFAPGTLPASAGEGSAVSLAVIAAGEPMDDWRADAADVASDRDVFHENLLSVPGVLASPALPPDSGETVGGAALESGGQPASATVSPRQHDDNGRRAAARAEAPAFRIVDLATTEADDDLFGIWLE